MGDWRAARPEIISGWDCLGPSNQPCGSAFAHHGATRLRSSEVALVKLSTRRLLGDRAEALSSTACSVSRVFTRRSRLVSGGRVPERLGLLLDPRNPVEEFCRLADPRRSGVWRLC